jgi:hypothetical protein
MDATQAERTRRPIAVTIAALIATLVMASGALPVLATATAHPIRVHVEGGDAPALTAFFPGDTLKLNPLEFRADGDLRYGFRAIAAGTPVLIEALELTVTSTSRGELLYRGPLVGAAIGFDAAGRPARPLAGGSELLAIALTLSRSAGNEAMSAHLAITWDADAVQAEGR